MKGKIGDLSQIVRKDYAFQVLATRKCTVVNYFYMILEYKGLYAFATSESQSSYFAHMLRYHGYADLITIPKCPFTDFLQTVRQDAKL